MNLSPILIITICSIVALAPICILISVICDISSIAKSLRIIANNTKKED